MVGYLTFSALGVIALGQNRLETPSTGPVRHFREDDEGFAYCLS